MLSMLGKKFEIVLTTRLELWNFVLLILDLFCATTFVLFYGLVKNQSGTRKV